MNQDAVKVPDCILDRDHFQFNGSAYERRSGLCYCFDDQRQNGKKSEWRQIPGVIFRERLKMCKAKIAAAQKTGGNENYDRLCL
jgi:hypothetical protein